MNKILVFGGTSEGRIISETLSANGFQVYVSVATDYGSMVLNKNTPVHILNGRLDLQAMTQLYTENNFDLIIDATHPFAKEVSKNIKECAAETNIPLVRFNRIVDLQDNEKIIYTEDVQHCKDLLLNTTGKILLTTGSKDLHTFCQNQSIRERLIVRVLPSIESLNICYENQLEGKQIIAMQGPFSESMNINQIEEYGISVLVTKESGKTGGTDSKISAALKKHIKCIVIKNSSLQASSNLNDENYFQCETLEKLFNYIEKKFSKTISVNKNITVNLIGIGMGNKNTMTLEAMEKINEADLIFGSERIISGIDSKAKKQPLYLAKDIIPLLKNLPNAGCNIKNVCVLFSGDSGFFSGTEKLKQELNKLDFVNVNILPGISSMSYLAAKTGISYQDAKVISLHGIEEGIWKPKLSNALMNNEKIFLLTSGLKNTIEAAKLILDYNNQTKADYKIAIGFQLSYKTEKVEILKPEECLLLKEEGLYSTFVFKA